MKALLDSVIRQSEEELAADGRPIPIPPYCWLLFGSAGRGEILVSSQPEIGVVFDDSANDSDACGYFSAVLEKTMGYLTKCGQIASSGAVIGNVVPACQSLQEWKQTFQSRIADPISNSVHQTRSLFDFQLVSGDRRLVKELKQVTRIGSPTERAVHCDSFQ